MTRPRTSANGGLKLAMQEKGTLEIFSDDERWSLEARSACAGDLPFGIVPEDLPTQDGSYTTNEDSSFDHREARAQKTFKRGEPDSEKL